MLVRVLLCIKPVCLINKKNGEVIDTAVSGLKD